MVTTAPIDGVAQAPGGRRIEQVDGLRALACLLVVWQHVSEVYRVVASGGLWLSTVADTVDFGRIGVCAFFAISGFVVPSSIRGRRVGAVVDFAERRFWRLFPPYWFSIPLGVLAVWTIWGKDPSLSMVFANGTMLASLWGEAFAMGHYWTLEVELAFYTLCGLLYLIFGRIALLVTLACLGVAVAARQLGVLAGTPNHWPFVGLDLAIMFWGCACRLVYDGALPARLGRFRSLFGYSIIGCGMLLVLWEPVRLLWIGFARDLAGHRRLGFGYSLGVLIFLVWVLLAQVRVRWLERIGKGTYSIYLLHPVVFYVALKLVRGSARATLEGWHLGVYLALLMPVCVAAGMLAYHLIERPTDIFRRLLHQPAPAVSSLATVAAEASEARPKRALRGSRAARASLVRRRSKPV